ncbi:MAG: hypothetical protein A2033_04780 [Bacteroidetes bacterium GWA2_31_9]|nr:MAG: hypothetical protein A2033_04780 [Bacteroidetes bacterium GWA2_31_9]
MKVLVAYFAYAQHKFLTFFTFLRGLVKYVIENKFKKDYVITKKAFVNKVIDFQLFYDGYTI